jgi:hypothetical protein
MLPERDACSTTARSSAVLPMPGSPVKMIIVPALVRAARRIAPRTAASSSDRPLSTTWLTSSPR